MSSKRKTRICPEKSKIGTDSYTFTFSVEVGLKNLPKQPLINYSGKKYGTVEAIDGKAKLIIVPSLFVRDTNIEPFRLCDSEYFYSIINDCIKQLRQLFGAELNSEIKAIECNITQKVLEKATQSDVLSLLCNMDLSGKRDNIKYVGANEADKYKEEIHTIIINKPHYYVVKAYDKTRQQAMKEKSHSGTTKSTHTGLLRIEIIMLDRTLKRLFGSKLSFTDILSKDSLIAVIREYKKIFCEDIINNKVKPYLNGCVGQLVESLCNTESIVDTIAEKRHLIPERRVLQKAIGKWQKLRGVSNNSARDARTYADKFDLPQDVILTLRDFKKACG